MDIPRFSETMQGEIVFITKVVEQKWASSMISYYRELGYEANYGDTILVRIDDLPRGSLKRVVVECPVCNCRRHAFYRNILFTNHSLCRGCAQSVDLRGYKSDRLTALGVSHSSHNGKYWCCLCDCGNETVVLSTNLTKSYRPTRSCGCLLDEMRANNTQGENNWFYGRNGSDHPNWKPELTDEERAGRRLLPNYYKFSRSVYERDDYTCRICNRRGSQVRQYNKDATLHAHHLFSYSEYPEYRTDINYAVTICTDCHNDFHISYMGGYAKPCTPQNFYDWLEQR